MNPPATPPTAENTPDAKEAMRHYLRGLDSTRRTIRDETLRQVRALPPESLLQLMQAASSQYRKRYRVSACIELALLLGWFIVCAFFLLPTDVSFQAMGLSFVFLISGVLFGHYKFVPWRAYKALVQILTNTQDVNLVGAAITMYVTTDGAEALGIIGKTLCRLLPQMTSKQRDLLTPTQKRDLLRLLGMVYEPGRITTCFLAKDVALQALRALEQIGDESAMPAVQSLLTPLVQHDLEISEAAERCLEFLKANAGSRREMQTLLRASDAASAVKTDTLLRPASAGSVSVVVEELLRPQV